MGAPKQKWTSEEESALKAGILKHGAGKWRTILKDPEFSGVLSLRSNVDLKDKWRNMSVTANGWGSREKARMALKRNPPTIKIEDNTMALERGVQSDEDVVDVKPLASSSGLLQITAPKKTISRLDNLICEAITTLKEPSGSNKTSITMYIEDHYEAPPNFKKILSAKLKGLTSNGKLIKVKRKYRIAPSGALSGARRNTGMPEVEGREGRQREAPRVELTRVQLDAELARMRTMSVREAALAAARAVKEAEAAIAEAEQAALEADEAEADAEAAQAFAEAAMSTLRTRNTPNVMVHG